jgi:hypothetical protein
MNKIFKTGLFLLGGLTLGVLPGCTDLDEEVYSAYTDKNFPSTPEQFAALTGPVYVAAQKFFDNNYFDLQQAGTDETIVPTRGGDWFDGGKWKDMHFHTWNPSHELVRNSWDWGFNAIGTCNRVLKMLEAAPESAGKQQTLAEIKTMRAWYYYNMMDAYGNLPLVTTFDQSAAAPKQETRTKIFEFIATELEANAPLLSDDVNAVTYGRPTKWMAHTLLAKLYLNAQVYTGTPQWDKVVENANKVIASNKFQLETNYLAQFKPDNGPQNREPIFSVPFDAVKAKGNLLFNKTLHYGHRQTYKLTTDTWNGWTTTPAFFDKYEEGDARKAQWLYGQQKNAEGGNLVYNGINVVLDPYAFPAFELGGEDNKGRLAGARNVKYEPDSKAISNQANNDVVIFRYADVLLMKAEAIVRGAGNGTIADALEAANLVRDRAFNGNPAKRFDASSLSLSAIYDERGREFAMEMTRRTDMIRFNMWEAANLFKPANRSETYRRIYPIPTTALAANQNLVQNQGY